MGSPDRTLRGIRVCLAAVVIALARCAHAPDPGDPIIPFFPPVLIPSGIRAEAPTSATAIGG